MEALLALFSGVLGTTVWTVREKVSTESCSFRTVDKSTDYLRDIEHGCFNL